jgi:hypothetical protein
MNIDPIKKAKLLEKKINKMYEKRAKVTIKELKSFKLNISLLVISFIFISIGIIIMGIMLGYHDGLQAIVDITSSEYYSSSNSNLKYYIGGHFGAVSIGLGIFIFILCLIGFIDDYFLTKKRIIERLIKEDQEKAAAEAAKRENMNIFQMLALNIKKSKLAN